MCFAILLHTCRYQLWYPHLFHVCPANWIMYTRMYVLNLPPPFPTQNCCCCFCIGYLLPILHHYFPTVPRPPNQPVCPGVYGGRQVCTMDTVTLLQADMAFMHDTNGNRSLTIHIGLLKERWVFPKLGNIHAYVWLNLPPLPERKLLKERCLFPCGFPDIT